MGKKPETPKERSDEQLQPEEADATTAGTEEDVPTVGIDEDVPSVGDAADTAAPDVGVEQAEPTPEPDETAQLRDDLAELQDRYLRLAAEFDNFRKRMVRERAADGERAKVELLRNILEGLDDLGRIAHLDLTAATADDVATGVQMVERKLLDELAAGGLERIAGEGGVFDPNVHEAVGSLPAPDSEQDHHVAQVLQVGYRFGGTLLRPARVLVFMIPDDGNEER